MREEKIPVKQIIVNNNRQHGGEGDIKVIAEDMKKNGLINPITVIGPPEDGTGDRLAWEIVAGRRRVAAAKLLGWETITARVLEGDEINNAEEIAGSENINRLGMHPLDEAVIFKKLLENGEPIEGLSKRFDRTVSAIYQRIQLLGLHDGIKELFRDGKLSLHAAAMLKSLDEERQIAFYEKYAKQDEIYIWEVKTFISKTRQDKLYRNVADKACQKCEKRTFYSDKALFPELSGEEDLCLDHECYMAKWKTLLSGFIKTHKKDNHTEASLIVFEDDKLAKIFGKSVEVDGQEYTVTKTTYSNRVDDKPSKTAKPCFYIMIEENADEEGREAFYFARMYWKELEKTNTQNASPQRENPFVPLVKLLEIPKEKTQQALIDLAGKDKDYWALSNKASEYERKVKHKVLDRLMDIVVQKPDSETNIDLFLKHFLEKSYNYDKNIIKKFAGSDKISDIKKLTGNRLFAMLYASTLNAWKLPDFGKFTPGIKNEIADWAGVPISKLKEMYLEELKLLMPKPAEEKKESKVKPAGKKSAKNKTILKAKGKK